MAEPSPNSQIADALTARALRTRRVEAGLRRDVWTMLAILETDILGVLKANDPTDFVLLARRRREVETLMAEELDPLIRVRYERIAAMIDAALMRLGQREADAVEMIVTEVDADKPGRIVVPGTGVIRRRVMETLFPSASSTTDFSTTGTDWWTRQAQSFSQRLGDQLTVSVSLEEPLTQMVARVRGTSDNAFQDGLIAKAKADAARLLTTQTTNAVSEARVAVADRNPEQFMLQHQSILDSRTSLICIGRNGLRYTVPEHEPIGHDVPYLSGPPYHPSCRSVMTTLLRDGGPVAEETLGAFLRRQSRAFQDELLGPTRAQLFRNGHLQNPRDLLDASTGRPLTLEELGA